MKDPNYAYFTGALETFIKGLPYNKEYNKMTIGEKSDYLEEQIKRMEERSIEFNTTSIEI